MKHIFLFIFLFIGCGLIAQAPSVSTGLTNAVDVKMPLTANAAFAQQQAQRWRQVREIDPQNSLAWWNDYTWTERDNLTTKAEKQAQLSAIVTTAAQYISQTSEYALMLFLNGGRKDSALLNKALRLSPNATWIYPYAIQYAATHDLQPQLKQYCFAYNAVAPVQHDLFMYHRNVLMSADSNATIYAKGLNDLVPMAILQQVGGIRKDIHLKYYEGKAEKGSYICLTAGSEVLSQYPNAVYTGLLVRVGGKDSLNELERHIYKDMSLDVIGKSGEGREMDMLNRNYLPGLLLLYKSYRKKNTAKAEGLEKVIRQIAARTGMTEEITKLLTE